MKTTLYIMIISIFVTGCCGGMPGSSGIDCTNYKAINSINIKLNMDSLNNGFKENEVDSTFIVFYESDSSNSYLWATDTAIIHNSIIHRYHYQIYLTQNLKTGNYMLKSAFRIFNSNTKFITEISKIEIELYQNEKKCCQEYKDDNIKNYLLNGVKKSGNESILISKR